jgi:hypothetical protein
MKRLAFVNEPQAKKCFQARATEKNQCVAIDASMAASQQYAIRNMASSIAINFLLTSPQ